MNNSVINKVYTETQSLFEDTKSEHYIIEYTANKLNISVKECTIAIQRIREDLKKSIDQSLVKGWVDFNGK